MRALTQKLRRDLVAQAAQAVTIAAVIGCGIAGYVAMRGTWKSLETSRDAYYQEYRFADVFAHLSRAPNALAARLEEIPGIAVLETRLVEPVRLPMPGLVDPAWGSVVSIPPEGPRLNDVWVREGRLPEPDRRDEALVLSAFAEAHELEPGDTLPVVMDGQGRDLRIVGLADSPEHVFVVAPGQMISDPRTAAVLWMHRDAMAPEYRMEGAFDDVVARLQPGVDPEPVLDDLDRLLEPWGGTGAVAREDQISHVLLEQEMAQLEMLATTIPVIFLGVGAFLLQVVLARIVQLQRSQIATLKAFGYTRLEIAQHYLGLVSAIGVAGAAVGLALGVWFGRLMTELYAGFFHLPAFAFHLDAELVGVSLAVSLLAAVLGGLNTVRGVVAMAPAEAMQPPSPPTYTGSLLDRLRLLRPLGPALRMVVRDTLRRPLRLSISVTAVAFATAVVVLGRFANDALDVFQNVLFAHVQAEDIAVTFVDPVPPRAVRALEAIPGVRYAEGQRRVAARFSHLHVERDGELIAYPPEPRLRRLIAWPLDVREVPEHGIALTDVLGEILGVGLGDEVEVELLYEEHARTRLPVVALVAEPFGLQGHVSYDTLARLEGERIEVDQAFLRVDAEDEADVMARLADVPGVLGATRKSSVEQRFREETGRSRNVFTLIASAFGAAMAVGVVYNNARIALASRARELASLRVLGFRRSEVAAIVLGEQALQLAIGVPIGLWIGRQLALAIMGTTDPETWRFPTVIASRTYAFAAVVVLGSAAVSGAVVVRRVATLDLVGVLKTRE